MHKEYIKRSIVIVLSVALIIVFSAPEKVFAADTTAPVINSISIKNADSIDGTSYLYADIDVTEDGSGVWLVRMTFVNEDGHTAYIEWAGEGLNGGTEPLLYTGKRTIKMPTSNKFALGEYTLQQIDICDRNDNYHSYYESTFPDILGDNSRVINVVRTNCKDVKAPIINSISIKNADSIDGTSYLYADIDVTEDGSGVWLVRMTFVNEDGHTAYIEWAGEGLNGGTEPLFYTGKRTIKMPTSNKFALGEYTLQQIDICDRNDNYRSYYESTFPDILGDNSRVINIVKTNCKDIKAPIINNLTIINEKITTPGLLEVDIDVTEDGTGVWLVQMVFENEDGHTAYIDWAGEGINGGNEPLFYTGEHIIKLPVNPFKGDGQYTLQGIYIRDRNDNIRSYYTSQLDDITSTKHIEISSAFNIAYYGSLRNINGAYEAILSMTDGDTVVLDCRDARIAPKKLFTAIAGKNRILVFEDEDVQWVFDGKEIQSNRCKDINLSTCISVQSGFAAGFPNDSKVVSIQFANNGLLPGEADVRVNNEYITQKYAGGLGSVKLSYIDDGVAELEDNDVEIADDNAAELKIKHNSTFVLSQSKAPQIKGVTIKKPKKSRKAITVKWKKQSGKSFKKHIDGYQIQYSKSSNFATGNKTKKIKGYKKTSCKINKLGKKKKYYVRVRTYLKYKGHTYYSNWSKTKAVKTR